MEWVKCSDRLPEKGEYVLAYGHYPINDWYPNPRYETAICEAKEGNEWPLFSSGCGCCDGSLFVSYWQPLPEPPKEAE